MSGSGDYISRDAANEACWKAVRRYPNSFYDGIEAARDAIRKLPAADVRPVRRGKWNIVKLPPDPGYKAKECASCKCNFWDLEEWNFCPNCGADMRGESDA